MNRSVAVVGADTGMWDRGPNRLQTCAVRPQTLAAAHAQCSQRWATQPIGRTAPVGVIGTRWRDVACNERGQVRCDYEAG
jgi:hypothetical protein